MTKRRTRQAPELKKPDPQPEMDLKPNVPAEGDILEVTVRIPLSNTPADPENYEDTLTFSKAVDVRHLTTEQLDVVSRLRRALRLMNYEESGRPVDGNAGAIRWLLQHVSGYLNGAG